MKHHPCLSSRFRSAVVCLSLLSAGMAVAHVPQLINYQGRVAVGAVNFDGSGQFKFAFVNPAGTVTFWSNDGTSAAGSVPAAAIPLDGHERALLSHAGRYHPARHERHPGQRLGKS